MPPAEPASDHQALYAVVDAHGTQIEILRGTIEKMGDNVGTMNGAIANTLAENVNSMRLVHERVSRVKQGMDSLYQQMTVLRGMLENITHGTSRSQ